MSEFEEELSNLPISISTNYGDYWNKAQLLTVFKDWLPQQPQQALPVVPEYVAEWYEFYMNGTFSAVVITYALAGDDKAFVWIRENGGMDLLCKMKLDGYTVEKPQLFKIIFPNSTAVLQKDGELNSFADTAYKRYLIKNAMTEQEIKSIDERYWQFAVPVEDNK